MRRRLRSIVRRDNALLIAAAGFSLAGAGALVAGWYGASRSIVVAEQIPYLISGGLLGVALVFLGALSCYGHVQSRTIRDAREREEQLERRHQELLATLAAPAPPTGRARRGSRLRTGD